ncbi:hypothetical protein AA101099_1289 [Neoasaia chiangmaiensis NBRC 101099]|uniref:Uncharacterized protein n=1 Tax=Neoasaia chiangmaiensis TaxID=320497 RepID=A0A1U9KQJ0_9PROT|nr:GNAT family N-acetyltransferase [Neoasaia chiangmaiensis]AQS88104.1 hypothetical protein A0U93_09275 [Neoasaia chiangmaiensis]GBR38683.1 hypothetical protein AA101099_1289 [Neoasaia chiangmaiensis NBRC 101099]GEN15794.1 hypothetical protein NCH01_22250 [Neoasaia chiangmaiensis]
MLRDLSPTTAPSGIIVEPAPTATWLATLAHAAGLTERARRGHADILSRIETPCAFATRYADGRLVGVGLAVLQQGHLGLFELAVAAPNRHQGHAQALMHALCNWGYVRNAQHAYLQVLADNLAAMRLYDQLGFAKAYRYDYWRRG